MPPTVYETRVMRRMLRWLAILIYRCFGWRTEGEKPDLPRYVIIAAPHTSNWDFFFTVCLAFIYRLKPQMMMKAEWFFWPLGPLFRWLGAIPIDRSRSNNIVAQSIKAFKDNEEMILVVPPAGTRRKVLYWKTGFYHIANGAGVPIALGYLDYRRKVGGFGPTIITTGNIDVDMATIRDFYAGVSGKHPLKESATKNRCQAGSTSIKLPCIRWLKTASGQSPEIPPHIPVLGTPAVVETHGPCIRRYLPVAVETVANLPVDIRTVLGPEAPGLQHIAIAV